MRRVSGRPRRSPACQSLLSRGPGRRSCRRSHGRRRYDRPGSGGNPLAARTTPPAPWLPRSRRRRAAGNGPARAAQQLDQLEQAVRATHGQMSPGPGALLGGIADRDRSEYPTSGAARAGPAKPPTVHEVTASRWCIHRRLPPPPTLRRQGSSSCVHLTVHGAARLDGHLRSTSGTGMRGMARACSASRLFPSTDASGDRWRGRPRPTPWTGREQLCSRRARLRAPQPIHPSRDAGEA